MFTFPYQYIAYPLHPAILEAQRTPSPYPPIQTERLKASTKQFQQLLQQANLLLDQIDHSDHFSETLMQAAQHSNTVEVNRLISSTGITTTFQTKFTPDGIRIVFNNLEHSSNCCELAMTLRW